MCFVYVDRPLTLPLPLVDKHGHFDNPPPPPLSTWFVHSPQLYVFLSRAKTLYRSEHFCFLINFLYNLSKKKLAKVFSCIITF